MRNSEEMGSNGWIEAKIWKFLYLGYDWHKNRAEGQKCSQNEPAKSHLQHIKILERIIKMRNGEEMGSNRWIEAKVWQFVCLGYVWHTKQWRRTKIQPNRAGPKPFTSHHNTHKDHTDEEWWRDGVKRMNRSRVKAVCVFEIRLTHKTVQKNQNAAKTSRPKVIYNAWKILARIIQTRNGEEMG